jgi:hypothetical protein
LTDTEETYVAHRQKIINFLSNIKPRSSKLSKEAMGLIPVSFWRKYINTIPNHFWLMIAQRQAVMNRGSNLVEFLGKKVTNNTAVVPAFIAVAVGLIIANSKNAGQTHSTLVEMKNGVEVLRILNTRASLKYAGFNEIFRLVGFSKNKLSGQLGLDDNIDNWSTRDEVLNLFPLLKDSDIL